MYIYILVVSMVVLLFYDILGRPSCFFLQAKMETFTRIRELVSRFRRVPGRSKSWWLGAREIVVEIGGVRQTQWFRKDSFFICINNNNMMVCIYSYNIYSLLYIYIYIYIYMCVCVSYVWLWCWFVFVCLGGGHWACSCLSAKHVSFGGMVSMVTSRLGSDPGGHSAMEIHWNSSIQYNQRRSWYAYCTSFYIIPLSLPYVWILYTIYIYILYITIYIYIYIHTLILYAMCHGKQSYSYVIYYTYVFRISVWELPPFAMDTHEIPIDSAEAVPCPLARRCAMLIGTHADVKRNRRQVSEEEPWA